MTLDRARELRRQQTEPEKLVWAALRRNQLEEFRFKRQVPIGPYYADFACLTARLVVEIDGEGHDQTYKHDQKRTEFLEKEGFEVIRFSNEDVRTNLEGVVETTRIALLERTGK